MFCLIVVFINFEGLSSYFLTFYVLKVKLFLLFHCSQRVIGAINGFLVLGIVVSFTSLVVLISLIT